MHDVIRLKQVDHVKNEKSILQVSFRVKEFNPMNSDKHGKSFIGNQPSISRQLGVVGQR
jgi:hypothetical protein